MNVTYLILYTLWQHGEPEHAGVGVEGEDAPDAELSADCRGRAVDERDVFLEFGIEEEVQARLKVIGSDGYDGKFF